LALQTADGREKKLITIPAGNMKGQSRKLPVAEDASATKKSRKPREETVTQKSGRSTHGPSERPAIKNNDHWLAFDQRNHALRKEEGNAEEEKQGNTSESKQR